MVYNKYKIYENHAKGSFNKNKVHQAQAEEQ
jgi:hypothetical protein